MKTCPDCRTRINVLATKCPSCHSQFDGMQMEVGRREHGRRRNWRLISVFVMVIAGIYVVMNYLSQPGVIEDMAERDAVRQFQREHPGYRPEQRP